MFDYCCYCRVVIVSIYTSPLLEQIHLSYTLIIQHLFEVFQKKKKTLDFFTIFNVQFSRTKHLDERLDNFQNIINKECPRSSPVILLMDNINMYKGNKRHYRLFKKLSPKMWNFTG